MGDGPTNRFGYETSETHFVELATAWKEDYPNTEHYFAFQIWPKACAMGFDGSDNRLREVQRRTPHRISRMPAGEMPSDKHLEIEEGFAEGNRVSLKLKFPWVTKDKERSLLTYVYSQHWRQDRSACRISPTDRRDRKLRAECSWERGTAMQGGKIGKFSA